MSVCLLSPSVRAVSRPSTSRLTTATSTWPRCCWTEGLLWTSWLGWVHCALCCLGVVLPAFRVNKGGNKPAHTERKILHIWEAVVYFRFCDLLWEWWHFIFGSSSFAEDNKRIFFIFLSCCTQTCKIILFLFCRQCKVETSMIIICGCLETPSPSLFKNSTQ